MTQQFSRPLPVRNSRGSGDEKFIEVDRYNRYVLPDPVTGQERKWTRVTTAVKTLDDTYYLELWKMRMVAYGVAITPHLQMLAGSFAPTELGDGNVKKSLDGVARDAMTAAGSDKGSSVGTALHNYTDRIDHGEQNVYVPPPYDRDVKAYVELLAAHRITIHPEWIEKVVVVPELGLAGKFDRLVELYGYPGLVVGDLKTQQQMGMGDMAIAMQESAYANAPYYWDPATETYCAMPEVDKVLGVVMHVPAGSGTSELHGMNVGDGWDALKVAIHVRELRKSRDWGRPVPRPEGTGIGAEGAAIEQAVQQHVAEIGGGLTQHEIVARELINGSPTRDLLASTVENIKKHTEWTSVMQAAAAARWEDLDV